MTEPGVWHKLGVYLGFEELTEEERSEAEAAEEQELARSPARAVAGVVFQAALIGLLFGLATRILWDDSTAEAIFGGVFFGVGMGALYLWQALSSRRKAARRVRERRGSAGP